MTLEVSLNSQQYTADNTSFFSFYESPTLSVVSPALGPVGGNTVVTVNGSALGGLGTHTLCRFNETVVAGTYDAASSGIVCPSATGLGAGTAEVRLSFNAQQYSASSLAYRYFESPQLSAVLPSSGPTSGGTTVQVSGVGLDGGEGAAPEYLCSFGNYTVAAVLGGDPATLSCSAPAQAASVLPLEVSLNGQNFTSAGLTFRWVAPITLGGSFASTTPQLSPPPAHGSLPPHL